MSKKFLTLNIGASSIQLAEYEAGAKGALTLVNYGTAQLAAPVDVGNADTVLSPALLEIVREKGIKPGKVAVSVSGQMVFPRFAAIPMAGGDSDKFDQLVRFEIEQNVPFPFDEMVCDRQLLGETATGDKAVMIVAAKVDQIEALTTAISAAGFSPEIVDVAPLALTNVLAHSGASAGGCSVVLDIGAKTTSLVIVEGEKIYNRSIPVAGNAITKEIAAALGCTQEEAEQVKCEKGYVSLGGVTEDDDEVADRVSKVCRAVLTRLNAEISRSINFYRSQQGGGAPQIVYLSGGTARLPQIDQFFADALQIEVAYLDPLEKVAVGSKVDATAIDADRAVIAATAGVALHAAGAARLQINLLPPSLVEAKAEKAKIPYIAAGGLGLVAALLMVMLGIDRTAAVVAAKRDAVGAKVGILESFDKKVKAATARSDAAVEAAEKTRALLADRSKAVARLTAIRDSLPNGMWIEKWDEGRITIRGWSDRIRSSGGKTAGEMIVDKIKGKDAVVRESVKISEMSEIGKDAQVKQITVELKFK